MNSCEKKQEHLKEIFASCTSNEDRYQKIILLGESLPPLAKEHLTEKNLVIGCQSQMYLHYELINQKIYFSAHSDALISKGLAAILIHIYNGESPETILKCPPTVLKNLQLTNLLSPSRSNGLASLLKKMQQLALYSLSY